MQLENEFLVDAPLDQTWSTLLDIRRVALCLPGAALETDGADGVYRGTMQVKLGPMSLRYKGTARMAEVEEDDHIATIEVQAKELKGQGTATARIRNRLVPGGDGGTKVTVQTDLSITGRPAQFGRGIMEDVTSKMLDDFALRLEREVLGAGGSKGQPPTAGADAGVTAAGDSSGGPAPTQPAGAPAPSDQLDLGSVLLGPLAKRAAIGGGAVLLLLFLVRLVLHGRKPGSLTVS